MSKFNKYTFNLHTDSSFFPSLPVSFPPPWGFTLGWSCKFRSRHSRLTRPCWTHYTYLYPTPPTRKITIESLCSVPVPHFESLGFGIRLEFQAQKISRQNWYFPGILSVKCLLLRYTGSLYSFCHFRELELSLSHLRLLILLNGTARMT